MPERNRRRPRTLLPVLSALAFALASPAAGGAPPATAAPVTAIPVTAAR